MSGRKYLKPLTIDTIYYPKYDAIEPKKITSIDFKNQSKRRDSFNYPFIIHSWTPPPGIVCLNF